MRRIGHEMIAMGEVETLPLVQTVYAEQPQAHQVPGLLRHVLSLPNFRTKALRMGKIIRVRPTAVEYYEQDRQVHTLAWSNQ